MLLLLLVIAQFLSPPLPSIRTNTPFQLSLCSDTPLDTAATLSHPRAKTQRFRIFFSFSLLVGGRLSVRFCFFSLTYTHTPSILLRVLQVGSQTQNSQKRAYFVGVERCCLVKSIHLPSHPTPRAPRRYEFPLVPAESELVDIDINNRHRTVSRLPLHH